MAPTLGPNYQNMQFSNKLSIMLHLDNLTVDDVMDEVEVTGQLNVVCVQMKGPQKRSYASRMNKYLKRSQYVSLKHVSKFHCK